MVEQRANLEEARKKIRKRRRIIWLSIAGALVLFLVFYSLYSFTDIFIGAVQKTVESSPGPGEWTMFHHDLSHTGSSGDSQDVPSGNIKWTFDAGDIVHCSPAVVDGVVYFGSRDRQFFAVDAETGDVIWSIPTGSWVESSPAVVGGIVYFGCNDSIVYALDAKTGAEIWTFSCRYAVRSSPAVADGTVYIGTDDHHVYALDAATGGEKWCRKTEGLMISSPAVYNGIVTIGCSNELIYTFNAGDGRTRLEYASNAPVNTSPAIKDGVAYFMDIYGRLHALDISKKNWLWENKLRTYWNALYVYGVAPRPPVTSGYLWSVSLAYGPNTASSVSLNGDYAYVGVGSNMLAVDTTTHEIAWTFVTQASISSTPAIVGDSLFFGGQDGHIYALNKNSGSKIWDIDLENVITSSPAVYNGVLFIGCDDGKFYAIE